MVSDSETDTIINRSLHRKDSSRDATARIRSNETPCNIISTIGFPDAAEYKTQSVTCSSLYQLPSVRQRPNSDCNFEALADIGCRSSI